MKLIITVNQPVTSLLTFTCSKSTMEALEIVVKYVQSYQGKYQNNVSDLQRQLGAPLVAPHQTISFFQV